MSINSFDRKIASTQQRHLKKATVLQRSLVHVEVEAAEPHMLPRLHLVSDRHVSALKSEHNW